MVHTDVVKNICYVNNISIPAALTAVFLPSGDSNNVKFNLLCVMMLLILLILYGNRRVSKWHNVSVPMPTPGFESHYSQFMR